MPFFANTKQNKSETIESHFEELRKNDNASSKEIGGRMLAFIDMIHQSFKETPIWGLTSHYRLVLQNQDKWDSDWYIIVSCSYSEYLFEYLLPLEKRPWEYAKVTGSANTLIEAKKYLLIAMKESGGWSNNEEVEKLLAYSFQLEKDLPKYILDYCSDFFELEEKQARKRFSLTTFGESTSREMVLKSPSTDISYGFNNPKTNAMVDIGKERFERFLVHEVLRKYETEILNFCNECGKLARTPKAKQCRYCGFDWH
jgi:hypothetical protein